MSVNWYLGCDPGANGGLALIDHEGQVEAVKTPADPLELWRWIHSKRSNAGHHFTMAALEKVGGHIQGRDQPGSAMFNFGKSYGVLVGMLTAAGISRDDVTPQEWQKSFGLKRSEHLDEKWKNVLKAEAQKIFSSVKVTLATADALLLAEYVRRKYG